MRRQRHKSALAALGREYLPSVDMAKVSAALAKDDLVMMDDDGSPLEGVVLCGPEGRVTFPLGQEVEDIMAPDLVFARTAPVPGGCLHLAWYRMASGRYEVTAYTSGV